MTYTQIVQAGMPMPNAQMTRKPTPKKQRWPSNIPLWMRLYDIIAKNPGVSRRTLHRSLSSKQQQVFREGLDELVEQRLGHARMIRTKGRSYQAWYPGIG